MNLGVTLVALNPVASARAEEFEMLIRETVVPAVRTARPDLEGHWQCLRATEEDQGVVWFAIVCELDGFSAQDWDLDTLLQSALSEPEANDVARRFDALLAKEQESKVYAPLSLWPQHGFDQR